MNCLLKNGAMQERVISVFCAAIFISLLRSFGKKEKIEIIRVFEEFSS